MTSRRDRLLLGLLMLTVVTGVIDAVSFLGLGRTFTANMTGNVVLLGFAVAGAPRLSVARGGTALLAFLVGAAAGGTLGARMAGGRRRWLVTAALVEGALLLAAAIIAVNVDADATDLPSSGYAVIVLTALSMGLQTATVRRLAVADVTTTVVTMTLAGVAADAWLAAGDNGRLGRRLAAIAALFGGAILGAFLLRLGLAAPLVIAAIGVLAATATYRDLVPAAQ